MYLQSAFLATLVVPSRSLLGSKTIRTSLARPLGWPAMPRPSSTLGALLRASPDRALGPLHRALQGWPCSAADAEWLSGHPRTALLCLRTILNSALGPVLRALQGWDCPDAAVGTQT